MALKYKVFGKTKDGDLEFHFELEEEHGKIKLIARYSDGVMLSSGNILELNPFTGEITIFSGIDSQLGLRKVFIPSDMSCNRKDC